MNNTITLSGGCACGAVRYESRAAQLFGIHCQCRQCQRISGSGHASQFALPVDAVRLTGRRTVYILKADSGNRVESSFCPVCGSPICKSTAARPDIVFFHAATLDNPSRFSAEYIVFAECAQPWDSVRLSADIRDAEGAAS